MKKKKEKLIGVNGWVTAFEADFGGRGVEWSGGGQRGSAGTVVKAGLAFLLLTLLVCFAKMPMPIMGLVFLFHFTANFAFLLTCHRVFTGYYMYGLDVLVLSGP